MFGAFKNLSAQEWKNVSLAIGIYCLNCLTVVTFDETFPLLAVLTKKDHGLSWNTGDVGTTWLIAGFFIIIFNSTCYTPLTSRLRTIGALKFGIVLCTISFFLFPLNSLWENWIFVYIGIYSTFILRIVAGVLVFNASNILINNACPEGLGGRINGIAFGIGAILKAVGPTFGATLFAWSANNNLPFPLDYTFVYNLNTLVSAITFFLAYLTPEEINSD